MGCALFTTIHAGVGDKLVAWLCRVALNRGYNALRSERRARQRMERVERMERGEQVPPGSPSDELASGVVRAEEQAAVRDVLARLPARQSAILLLRSAGCSYAEIATALHIKPGSVGTLLSRAERAFVARYRQQGGEGVVRLEKKGKVKAHDPVV